VGYFLMESLAIAINDRAVVLLVGPVDADEQAGLVGLFVDDSAPSIERGKQFGSPRFARAESL
jgi:hypothetical protein